MNFGPKFKYPITDESFKNCKPVNKIYNINLRLVKMIINLIFYHFDLKISDLATDKFIDHTLADLVYHVEHDGSYD